MSSSNNPIPITDVRSAVEAISAEDDSQTPLQQIESLCMRCHENGMTSILLTRIPNFREVVLMAFECPHCHERNNEVQFAGQLQPKGCSYTLRVPSGDQKMLNRQVVKSDSATIKIPELDFEIPKEAQRGTLSTVEGVLLRAVNELQALQDERKKVDPETAEAIDRFLMKLNSCAKGDVSFTFILDDPSGNSFIENPFAPSVDPSLTLKFYERTNEQQAMLGFVVDPSSEGQTGNASQGESDIAGGTANVPHGSVGAVAFQRSIAQGNSENFAASLFRYSTPDEVMTFPSTCGSCAIPCETRMFVFNIPYFQQVIIMASTCDGCGYRNSELKAGGHVPEKGKKITVLVKNQADLSRDVIKSDHASVSVPELDLELGCGTLGGLVTTIEGLITKICENLDSVQGLSCGGGDSSDPWTKAKWQEFSERLSKLLNVEEPWTLILDDGLARSFVSPVTETIEDDHQLIFEEYERTWDQNEELGLNDIDTSSADMYYDTNPTATATTTPSKIN